MRRIVPYVLLAVFLAALGWAVSFGSLPPADFTFCNHGEIKTVDPAIVSGQAEGRVIWALFEGLCRWHPETLESIAGVAERWEVSDDGLRYTFHLRADALWSDGTPLTAHDFAYSFRRMLHPLTAAEYASQAWYISGSKKFSTSDVEVGDPVEIELNEQPAGARPFAPGKRLRGLLREIEASDGGKTFGVEIDGRLRRFRPGTPSGSRAEPCRLVTYDFEHVGVKVLDARTIRFELHHPVPYFVQLMGFYPFSPVNRRCVETYGYPAWTKPENIVSNGAYRLEARRIRDRVRLVRSETYWNRARVKTRVIDVLATAAYPTMLNQYLTGDTDWIPVVPAEVVPHLLKRPQRDFRPAPYLSTYYYTLNTSKPPLDDARVRRALALSINRRQIVEDVTKSGQVPAWSLVPAEMSKYIDYTPAPIPHQPTPADLEERRVKWPDDDENVREARRLMAAAGYPGGRGCPKIDILYNTSESHKTIAEVIQSNWKEALGVDVSLRNQEWAAYLSSRRQGDFMIARAGWIGDYIDPNTFLDLFLSDGPQNHTRWKSAEYDRLIDTAQREADLKRRYELFHQAEALLLDEVPVIPIYLYVSQSMVRTYVKGFYHNIQDVHPLWAIEIDEQEKARVLKQERLR